MTPRRRNRCSEPPPSAARPAARIASSLPISIGMVFKLNRPGSVPGVSQSTGRCLVARQWGCPGPTGPSSPGDPVTIDADLEQAPAGTLTGARVPTPATRDALESLLPVIVRSVDLTFIYKTL